MKIKLVVAALLGASALGGCATYPYDAYGPGYTYYYDYPPGYYYYGYGGWYDGYDRHGRGGCRGPWMVAVRPPGAVGTTGKTPGGGELEQLLLQSLSSPMEP